MLLCLYDAVYARPLCESAAGSNGKPFSLVNNSVDYLPFFQRRRFSTSPTFRILMILTQTCNQVHTVPVSVVYLLHFKLRSIPVVFDGANGANDASFSTLPADGSFLAVTKR